jgi:alanine racemase
MAKLLTKCGVDWLCVNSLDEAILIRDSGIKLPLLILNSLHHDSFETAINLNARFFLYDLISATKLDKVASKLRIKAKVHVKVDTGMSRQGVLASDFERFMKDVSVLDNIHIEGVATHFATSDQTNDQDFFKRQLTTFKKVVSIGRTNYKDISVYHCANSGATLAFPESHFDLVRTGISVYGYYPSEEVMLDSQKNGLVLQPAMSFKTSISCIKSLPEDSYVGYSNTHRTRRNIRLALLPIGYHDGLDRKLSNQGYVLINGSRAPIIGRISMNITTVDVTDIDASPGDIAVAIGRQGDAEISADEIAFRINSINYEVISRLSENIDRYYSA